jgi:hypothetical protein
MNHAIILSATYGFYIGTIKTVNSVSSTRTGAYNFNNGFLMPYTINADTCVKGGTYTLTTSTVYP